MTQTETDKDRVVIFDTTLRDGEQCPGATMTHEEKLEIAELLDEMGVGVIFAGAIMPISGGRCVRREFFQPDLVIVMESGFIVINKHRGGDVHGVDETKALGHFALVNKFLDLRRDVDEAAPARHLKPKMFSERFHIREVDG